MSVETFSECLRAWLKETSRSIASVAAETGLKSKTTVARILRGQTTSQGCEQFYGKLSGRVQMEEDWRNRFRAALRVERIGPQEYLLFEALRQRLRMPLRKNTGSMENGPREYILILGCPWQETYDYIDRCLSQNSRVSVLHYMAFDELYGSPPALAGLLTFLLESRYQAFLIGEKALFSSHLSWNIMMRVIPDSGEEQIAVGGDEGFRWLQTPAMTGLFSAYQGRLRGLEKKQLYQNENLRKGSDYIRLMKESWQMENQPGKVLLKPTPGIQMLPADLGIASFSDYLDKIFLPISAASGSIKYYYRKRAESFYRRDTKMILSHQAMLDFVRSGKLADQFYACRPFSREERLAILQYLLACMDQPHVTILFSKEEELSRSFSLEAYSRFGTLIYPSQTSYHAENSAYRELILPGGTYADLISRFAEEILIPENCCTAADTRLFLNSLISMLRPVG